jgi:hypothetical protein
VGWWNSTAANWQKFGKLTWPEKKLLIQAFLVLPCIKSGLSLIGFKRLYARLGRQQPAAAYGAVAGGRRPAQALITTRMVQRAANHHLCKLNCLPRSLALWWLLRRQGIGAELRIGTRRHEDQLEAHAWVEFEGSPLNEYDDVRERYAAFDAAILPPS